MRWSALVVLALAASCGRGGSEAERVARFDELERLVFVPAGQSDLLSAGEDWVAAATEALLVDRFEVRRRDIGDGGEGAELPASFDWFEAKVFAGTRGMRLPTVSEWVYIASGRLGHAYPWGQKQRRSVANTLELGLLRTAPVGTFESGRGPFGTYDQIGNVWEWAEDYATGEGPIFPIDPGGVGGLHSVLGGSYLTRLRPLFSPGGRPLVFSHALDPGHRAPDVGLRCVAAARSWLKVTLPGLDPKDDVEAKRLGAVGALWFQTGEGQLVELLKGLEEDLAGGAGSAALAELERGAQR
jgi:hypothetical protein